MAIIESIEEARRRGASDDRILQEIIRQNPVKGRVFSEEVKRGVSSTEILERLIKERKEMELKKIEEAKKRIEKLKEKKEDEKAERAEGMEKAEQKIEEEQKTEEKERQIDGWIRPRIEAERIKEIQREKEEEKRRITIEEQRRQELIKRLQGKKEEVERPVFTSIRPKEIVKNLPQKPSPKAKLWLRIVIVVLSLIILSGVVTFWYWFLVVRKQPPIAITCSSDTDCQEGQICSSKKICVDISAILKCSSDADCSIDEVCEAGKCVKKSSKIVFPTAETKTLEFLNSAELYSSLSRLLQEKQNKNQFIRLIFKDLKNNTILNLKELFEKLSVNLSEDFYQKVDNNNFVFFAYSQKEGNRLGFVVRIKNYKEVKDLLQQEEPRMEGDFQTLFELMGKKDPAVVPYFRDASDVQDYIGPNFRYQTLSRQDLGILYLVSEDYFLFASSWKSMEEAIKKLENNKKEKVKLTKDLKLGDKGEEVKILQKWLAQDTDIYPQALINGYFDNSTKEAVIKFQEKYASEILVPQGLFRGTGVVDALTRKKLNQLYEE